MKLIYFAYFYVLLVSALAVGQSNPVPLISQPLVPASAAPRGKGFTLTINGTGFTSTAEVYWNGSLRPTTVVSASTLQAQISAADIAKPGFGWVTVGNLGAGEIQSNVVYFPIRAAAKGVGFLPRSIQNVANPGPVVVGDFNNDGLLDFATPGIDVFLGKGNGTFQLPVSTSAPDLDSMVAGDFNGDGNLDLAVIHDGHYLSVFLGNGQGTFPTVLGPYQLFFPGPASQPQPISTGMGSWTYTSMDGPVVATLILGYCSATETVLSVAPVATNSCPKGMGIPLSLISMGMGSLM
jgi:hypothetical protein